MDLVKREHIESKTLSAKFPDLSENYRQLIENTVECIWIYNLNHKWFRYISPSIYKLRGLTVDEAMNESLEDSLTPESLQKIKNASLDRYPKFIAGDRSDNVICDVSEYQQYCKDGSIIDVEISTKLVIDKETRNIDVVGVSRDITKRKQQEEGLIKKLREQEDIIKVSNENSSEEIPIPRVYLFGDFRVYGAGRTDPIKWRTLKAKELFAFICHKRCELIPKWEICEALWPEMHTEKIRSHLHTTIYKMKKDLLSSGINVEIKFSNNIYRCIMPTMYYDVSEFNDIIQNSYLPFDRIDEPLALDYKKAIIQYEKGYFAEDGYIWSSCYSEIYGEKIHLIAIALARYYISLRNFMDATHILLKMLDLNNLDEVAQELLLQVYIYQNDRSAFLTHYDKFQQLLFDELGVLPKESIRILYDKFR